MENYMNHVKTGKLIAECRRERHCTQAELAEKLDITDTSVSKWECGRSSGLFHSGMLSGPVRWDENSRPSLGGIWDS